MYQNHCPYGLARTPFRVRAPLACALLPPRAHAISCTGVAGLRPALPPRAHAISCTGAAGLRPAPTTRSRHFVYGR
ncbi:MAG: hypothetical protein H0W02_00690, partial [Ktedonobacteraceae bacterium]|nr:hypothetical protein [Ktedonobacteraceae bacterium]